jgi:copper chaperone CopZ
MKTRNLISLLFAAIIVVTFTSCGSGGTKAEKQPEATVMAEEGHGHDHLHFIKVSIEGMTCEGCENTVKGAITKIAGVDSVMATHTDAFALTGYAGATPDTAAIRTAITEAGYKVTGFAFVAH